MLDPAGAVQAVIMNQQSREPFPTQEFIMCAHQVSINTKACPGMFFLDFRNITDCRVPPARIPLASVGSIRIEKVNEKHQLLLSALSITIHNNIRSQPTTASESTRTWAGTWAWAPHDKDRTHTHMTSLPTKSPSHPRPGPSLSGGKRLLSPWARTLAFQL
ncbi:hypothetical protein JHK87_000400 [Glycine soja]|nr:hypothetical protein JHK87_000400 [Glycine soja]